MSPDRENRPTPFGKPPNSLRRASLAPSPIPEGGRVSETLRRVLETLDSGGEEALRARCARHLRRVAYLLDADRLRARTAARLAWRLLGTEEVRPTERDIAADLDGAVEDLLAEDREALGAREGEKPRPGPRDTLGGSEASWNGHHVFLTQVFALDPGSAHAAAVRFNDLDGPTRRAFMALLIEGRSIEDCEAAGLGSADELGRFARSGLRALFLLDGDGGENEGPEATDP